VDPKYSEAYRELFEKHWWWRSRTEFIIEKLRRLQPPQSWKRILDIGCGDALFFDRLAEFGEVEGVEPCAELLKTDNPHRSRIYTARFDSNFRTDKRYSLIFLLDVLEHLENPVSALRHALDFLTPDGLVVITAPAFMALWTNHDVLNEHRIRYTKRSFREVARKAGFHIQEERYFYHWTFPVKLGIRIVEKASHARPRPPKLPPDLVNRALFQLSRLEQKTLSALPMPFGSSLLVIGGKAKLN